MALVLMATHGWGTLFIDPSDLEAGVGLQSSFTTPALVAATHYADDAGASPSTGPVTADANGRLMRYIEEGTYVQTLPGGATLEVQAVSGATVAATVGKFPVGSPGAKQIPAERGGVMIFKDPFYVHLDDYFAQYGGNNIGTADIAAAWDAAVADCLTPLTGGQTPATATQTVVRGLFVGAGSYLCMTALKLRSIYRFRLTTAGTATKFIAGASMSALIDFNGVANCQFGGFSVATKAQSSGTATIADGSNVLTGVTGTGYAVGDTIIHYTGAGVGIDGQAGIPSGTTITNINADGANTLRLSANAGSHYVGQAVTAVAATDLFTKAAHGYVSGSEVKFSALTGGAGITAGTSYYVIPFAGQAVTAVAATDVLTSTAHGFTAGTELKFTGLTGGAGIGSGFYYVIASGLTANDYKVATAPNGTAVDITSDMSAGTVTRQMSRDIFQVSATPGGASINVTSDLTVGTVTQQANFTAATIRSNIVVSRAVKLWWDNTPGSPTQAARSTLGNVFDFIEVSIPWCEYGIQLGNDGANNQVDSTHIKHIYAQGAYIGNSGETYLWQGALKCGSGVFSNNLVHRNDYNTSTYWRRNLHMAQSELAIGTWQPQNAESDIYLEGHGGYLKIESGRGESSQRLLSTSGGTAVPTTVSIKDFDWSSNEMHSDGRWINIASPGFLKFGNFRMLGIPKVTPRIRATPPGTAMQQVQISGEMLIPAPPELAFDLDPLRSHVDVAYSYVGSGPTLIQHWPRWRSGVQWRSAYNVAPSAERAEYRRRIHLVTGTLDETVERDRAVAGGAAATGVLVLMGLVLLVEGEPITNILTRTSTTLLTGPANQWMCLIRAVAGGAVLAKTEDKLTEAWAASTDKSFAITGGPYAPTVTEAAWIGIVTVGTSTSPTFWATATGDAGLMGKAPIKAGTANTGLTNPASLGSTVGAITAVANVRWAAIN